MKERPILFYRDMVRAILDGPKTQTRRVLKVQPLPHTETVTPWLVFGEWQETEPSGLPLFISHSKDINADGRQYACPYGKVGDLLWVRETHGWGHTARLDSDGITTRLFYRADFPDDYDGFGIDRWKPSIFLHREDSRILLEITDVRCERVQEISEADAKAEGAGVDIREYGEMKNRIGRRAGFEKLWDSINGKKKGRSFADNPWCWRIEFKVVEGAVK